MSQNKVRTCSECGKVYQLNKKYFSKGHGKFRTVCRDCINKHNKLMYNLKYDTIEGVLFLRCKRARERARYKNMEFDITPEFLLELWNCQGGKCFYSGLQMTYDRNDLYTVSVDRIDSNKGYTKKNVVLTCWSVNSMKNSYKYEEFIALCKAVVDYSG